MIQFRLLAVAAAAAGLVFAMPTAAAVKVATYTGIVASGQDYTGVFGLPPDTQLVGYNWRATFTYDRNLGTLRETDGDSFDISRGEMSGSPIIKATFTLNGVTKTIMGADLFTVT